MTAHSELFVDETIRDCISFNKELKKLEEKGTCWHIEIPNNWKDIWSDREYPEIGNAKVMVELSLTKERAEQLKKEKTYFTDARILHYTKRDIISIPIGYVTWITKFDIEKGISGKNIEASPSKVKLQLNKNMKMLKKIGVKHGD